MYSENPPAHPPGKDTPRQDRRQTKTDETLLSPREREVLHLLARGLTTERIATVLQTSGRTVEKQIAAARKKLSATTREQAVALAVARGLIRAEE